MKDWYKEDLAYIHDVGFSEYALKSAPGILAILAQHQIRQGLIVDLGCGSGLSAQEFTKARYRVLGVDISEPLIAIARTRVPEAEFQVASFLKADIPPCSAVTAIGECLNYLFDPDNERSTLASLFHRVYGALMAGGMFIFDIAEPGQVRQGTQAKSFTEGEDWVVLVEKEEHQEHQLLTRRIITFRKLGESYRRDDEIHHLRLYQAADIARELYQVGFQVQVMRSYGHFNLPKGHVVFIARKPT